MLTKVPKLSTVFITVGHQKTFYHLGKVELFRCSWNKFLVDNLRERYKTHKRAEIPEPPGSYKHIRAWSRIATCRLVKCATCIAHKPFSTGAIWIPKNVQNRFLKGARPVCSKNSPTGDHALKTLKHKLVLGVDWKSRYYIGKWQKMVVLPCPYCRSWGLLAFFAPIRWFPYKQTWIQVLAFPRVRSQIMHD